MTQNPNTPDLSPEAVAKMLRRLRATPLYQGHGEASDLPDEAADLLDALSAKLAEAEAERDGFAMQVTGLSADNARVRSIAEAAEATIAHLEAHVEGTARDTHRLLVGAEAERDALRSELADQDELIVSLRQANEEMAGKLVEAAKVLQDHGDTARKKLREAYDAGDIEGNGTWSCIVAHLDIAHDALCARAKP
jgi:chromosome segregation ATPase